MNYKVTLEIFNAHFIKDGDMVKYFATEAEAKAYVKQAYEAFENGETFDGWNEYGDETIENYTIKPVKAIRMRRLTNR